jgi:hypothetical protein
MRLKTTNRYTTGYLKCPCKAPGDQIQSKKLRSESGPQEPSGHALNVMFSPLDKCGGI